MTTSIPLAASPSTWRKMLTLNAEYFTSLVRRANPRAQILAVWQASLLPGIPDAKLFFTNNAARVAKYVYRQVKHNPGCREVNFFAVTTETSLFDLKSQLRLRIYIDNDNNMQGEITNDL